MKICPQSDWVMVKPVEPQAEPETIIVPDAHKKMRIHGVVLEVGPGRVTRKGHRVPMEVNKGQIVCIGRNPVEAQQVVIGNEDYLLIPERAILAIVSA